MQELALINQDRISAEKLLRWGTITELSNPTYLPRLKQILCVLIFLDNLNRFYSYGHISQQKIKLNHKII